MKQIILAFSIVNCISITAYTQSPQTPLIEHFTNTRCGICASRNPAFYQTLSNYPQVLHIAFHPSSPYSQCYFSLQNPTENDARTHYYNAYGSTPKVTLNGKLLGGANPLINNTTLDTALGKTSPVEIRATEELIGTDSVKVRVVVRTTGTVPVANALLFAGVAEEPVNYNAQNGETVHHDVFRKSLTASVGNQITVPAMNDSLVLNFTYAINSGWNVNNIYTLAFFQRIDTKEILNAAKSIRIVSTPTAVGETTESNFSVLPNPVSNQLQITGFQSLQKSRYTIYNTTGQTISEGEMISNTIDVTPFPNGLYYLKLANTVKKFLKQ